MSCATPIYVTTVVEPGDTLFVPAQFNKSNFVHGGKEWMQIPYQLGLGLASSKSLGLEFT